MSGSRVISAAALLLIGWGSFAQSTEEQEGKIAALQREIELINSQLKQNENKSSAALSNLSLLRKKISNRNRLISENELKMERINQSICAKEAEISSLERHIDTLSHYYSRLVHSAYKNRDSRMWYMYVLASDNLGQAFRRLNYLRGFSSRMNEEARKITEAKAALESDRAELLGMKSEIERARRQKLREVERLNSEQRLSEQEVARLKKDQKKYRQELDEKRRQVDALNREIAAIIRKASSGSKVSSEAAVRLSSDFASNKGRLPWPVDGVVVDSFGQHEHPAFKGVKMPFNNGVTIATAKDARVRAVFDGEVTQIVVMPGYSQCVLVQHGEYFTFYCKLGHVAVKAGDQVQTGQTVGTVDTIASETQLHFQLWSGRNPQNPELWLAGK